MIINIKMSGNINELRSEKQVSLTIINKVVRIRD